MAGNSFLRRTPAILLTLALLLQAALLFGFTRTEVSPYHTPLSALSRQVGGWLMQDETQIDAETQSVLRADDTVSRNYVNPARRSGVNLFVAFFKSQRTGQTPHSPRNCLPGSGWVPLLQDTVQVDLPGRPAVPVNRYIVQKGEAKSMVLYWYQSRDRIVATEYQAKFYVIADALRYNRTDTALVRVVVPYGPGYTAEDAERSARDFIYAMYPSLRQHFPV